MFDCGYRIIKVFLKLNIGLHDMLSTCHAAVDTSSRSMNKGVRLLTGSSRGLVATTFPASRGGQGVDLLPQ